MPAPANTHIIKLTPHGQRISTARIVAAITEPINMAFDDKTNRLLIFLSSDNELIDILEGPDGNLDLMTSIFHDASHFGLQNPQGMTVDPISGHLLILDTVGPKLVRIEPEPDGGFDNALISEVDLQATGLVEVRGLAFDPTTGHLHLSSLLDDKLYELTQTGQVVAIRDLSEFGLRNPQSMVFAPSGDLTDDPSELSLFIADSGLMSASGEVVMSSPGTSEVNTEVQASGQIVELSFAEPVAAMASTFQSSLIQTINAWQWSPPSPDSAGAVYLPSSDRLLVCDSEVNEMPIFTGDNLFKSTLTGVLESTLTTISFSDEPTGVTLNPFNGHLFFSDDTGTRSIYELNPGPDGLYDTSDDIITSFATDNFGSHDPEGVTYANEQGVDVLYIADGVNREVYRVDPGGNGIFDGVDDQVTSFDTAGLGLGDPEGIAFNPDNGNLYVVGSPSGTLFEITTDGALVQTIDISAANAVQPAGLAYAPNSQDPGQMSIYIAARGIDNGSNPNENDGMVYEMSLPPLPNYPPAANNDSAITTEGTSVTIDVAANDTDPDGNLDPATANTNCGICTVPANGMLLNNGNGTFGYTPNPGFMGNDSFTYEICDTDALCDTAMVNITVTPPNDPPVANGDSASTTEDALVVIDVATNDTDPDGNLDPATANSTCSNGCNGAANGTLNDNGDGTI
ncbi:MAG: Ig-like domain-containing protein, partial [Planctomycetota bacterium]